MGKSCGHDWDIETRDMKRFQALVRLVVKTNDFPVSLTSILTVHHNLVTFGVEPSFLRPQNVRAYFLPSEVCVSLKRSSVFEGDDLVGRFQCHPVVLDDATLPGLPATLES